MVAKSLAPNEPVAALPKAGTLCPIPIGCELGKVALEREGLWGHSSFGCLRVSIWHLTGTHHSGI